MVVSRFSTIGTSLPRMLLSAILFWETEAWEAGSGATGLALAAGWAIDGGAMVSSG